ncbi:uncharacterized protein [Argopecten irradians]|uniref:uncharacterized protein n=1 Tax=Argopecten irradians TaxID=31199 RepID=UPI0037217791
MASKYHSNDETTNFARVCRLVLDVCSDVLRAVLDTHIPPPGLTAILQSQRDHIRQNLERHQLEILFPPGGRFSGTLNDLDFSLLYRLVRNIKGINIPPPTKGWGRKPDTIDRSLGANIERLRFHRNKTYGHLPCASLSDIEFRHIWDTIRECIEEIEQGTLTGDTYVKAVDNLLIVSMDPHTEKVYIERMRKQEDEFKAILKDIDTKQDTLIDKQEAMATDITDVITRQDTMATDITDVITRQETMSTNITDVSARQETMSTNITDVITRQETMATNIIDVITRQETMTTNITDVSARQETMATNITDVSAKQETMATDITDISARQDTMATDITDVSARQETMATNITDVSAKQETMATDITDISARQDTMATNITDVSARQETMATDITDISARQDTMATNITDVSAKQETMATDITDISARQDTMATNITDVSAKQETMATDITDISARQETMTTNITDVSARQETMATNITDVSAKQETMATDITDISARQDTMATDITDVSARQETMEARQTIIERNMNDKEDIHKDLIPMIETTKHRIKQEKEKKKFLKTKAFRDAKDKLQKNRVLVIKGNTGDGKTATAIQLLAWLMDEQHGRQPIQVHNIHKLDLLTPNANLIACIDDIFGEKYANSMDVQEWNKRISHIETLFCDSQSQGNFLIITIRNEVFNALKKSSLQVVFTEDNIIDMSSNTYKMFEEKQKLLELYTPNNFTWEENEINAILAFAPNIGFPQCCQLFRNSLELQKSRVDFFEKPVQFLVEALSKLPECSAILFLFLNGGRLMVSDLDPNADRVNESLLEEAFEINLLNDEDATVNCHSLTFKKKIGFVKKSLDTLSGFLVKKTGFDIGNEVYVFDHDSIYVTVGLLYGNTTPVGYIQKCPMDALVYITTSTNSTDKVVISSNDYGHMCERLLKEIESETYGSIIGRLDVWKDCMFLEAFIRFSKRNVDRHRFLKRVFQHGVPEVAFHLLSEGVEPAIDANWWSLITRGRLYDKGEVDVLQKVFRYINDEIKLNLLSKSCTSGSEDCALYLLSMEVKPDKKTPFKAVRRNCSKVLRELKGVLNDEIRHKLLFEACGNHSLECALYLLGEGVKPDKDTPLWKLVTWCYGLSGENVDGIKEMVAYLTDDIKSSLLNELCSEGFEECALHLLSEGIKPDVTTSVCAVKGNCLNVLTKVIKSANEQTKCSLLNEAFSCCAAKCALYLLHEGFKPDIDTNWWSLFSVCIRSDILDELKEIELFMDDDIKLELLNTACRNGSEKCVLYLLSEGVKPDVDTPWGSYLSTITIRGERNVDALRKIDGYLNGEMKLELFLYACEYGFVESALYLLHSGVKPNIKTDWWSLITRGDERQGKGDLNVLKEVFVYLNNETKLYLLNNACRSGSLECALYFLSKGVKPDKQTPSMAAMGGKVDLLKRLDISDDIRKDVLDNACSAGSEECVLYLLSEGAVPDSKTPLWSLMRRGNGGTDNVTLLEKIVGYLNSEMKVNLLKQTFVSGSVECALYLLRQGVEPDRNTDWWSLISRGNKGGKGDIDILQKVLKFVKTETKTVLLNIACDTGSEECALYLLSEDVKPDNCSLFSATKANSVNILKTVLKDVTYDIKLDVLLTACQYGSKECVLYLLSEGINLNRDAPVSSLIEQVTSNDRLDVLKRIYPYMNETMKLSLLNSACDIGSEECVLYLLSEGVKPDKNTPKLAAKKGFLKVFKTVTKGLKRDIKTALLNETCSSGALDCVLYLLSEGVKPDEKTDWFPLIQSRFYAEHVNVVKKVWIYLNDAIKQELLNEACRSGFTECALHLLSEGGKPNQNIDWWTLIKLKDSWRFKGDTDILMEVFIYIDDEIKPAMLNKACSYGLLEHALFLLNRGVKPDKDTDWWSLIRSSNLWGSKGNVEKLNRVVTFLNEKTKLALLNTLCASGSQECALYLLRHGIKPDQSTDWLPLIADAFEDGWSSVGVMKKLIGYMDDEMKEHLLNKLCKPRFEKCAHYLLRKGVKPNKDTNWWSLAATPYGNADVDVLKRFAVYLNEEMKLRLLNLACQNHSKECVLYLLSEGVKPDKDRLWSFIYISMANVDALQQLVQYLSVEMKLNLLHMTCSWGLEDCALYLLDSGVQPDTSTVTSVVQGRCVNVLRNIIDCLSVEMKIDAFNEACRVGSEGCALVLLSDGVEPNQDTAFDVVEGGSVTLLKMFINDLNEDTKVKLLHKACVHSPDCALHLLYESVLHDKDIDLWPLLRKCDQWFAKVSIDVLRKVVLYSNDEMKNHLFITACKMNLENNAIYLLSEGAKPDKDTPWWRLITKGHSDDEEDADILKKVYTYLHEENKLDLLNAACCYGAEKCVLLLLGEGVKPKVSTPLWQLFARNHSNEENVDLLKRISYLIDDETKTYLLYSVCYHGLEKCTLYLLSEGVKPAKNTPWWSLIDKCGYKKGKKGVEVLDKIAGYLNDEMKKELLNAACRYRWWDCAEYLLCGGVLPDKNTDLWTLIQRCQWYEKGDVNILKKIQLRSLSEETKLYLLNKACSSHSTECAIYLLREGVQPDKDTNLWFLIAGDFWHCKGDVDVLKEFGMCLSDETKLDLLKKACDSGSEDCALYLMCEGAKPDSPTDLWALITGGDMYCKGDVDVLKRMALHLSDEIKRDLLKKACDSGSEDCALYLQACITVD